MIPFGLSCCSSGGGTWSMPQVTMILSNIIGSDAAAAGVAEAAGVGLAAAAGVALAVGAGVAATAGVAAGLGAASGASTQP